MNLEQHPKRGILKDVSKQELLQMRKDGLCNQEIADKVGCSYATIYNILGKQPPEMGRRVLPKKQNTETQIKSEPAPEISTDQLDTVEMLVHGKAGLNYKISCKSSGRTPSVCIMSANGMDKIYIRMSVFNLFIRDLIALGNLPQVRGETIEDSDSSSGKRVHEEQEG